MASLHIGTYPESSPSLIEQAVDQLVRQTIEDDAHCQPAPDVDRIILDIVMGGTRYLTIRCGVDGGFQGLPHMERVVDDCASLSLNQVSRALCSLSPRELEVARMVAKGYANKSIASVLEISTWTVSSHLRRIYSKLDVTSRAAMVARLLENGKTDQVGPAPTPLAPGVSPCQLDVSRGSPVGEQVQ